MAAGSAHAAILRDGRLRQGEGNLLRMRTENFAPAACGRSGSRNPEAGAAALISMRKNIVEMGYEPQTFDEMLAKRKAKLAAEKPKS